MTTPSHRLTFRELIDEIKGAREAAFYTREPLPPDLFKDLRELTCRRASPTIEIVVEDFRDVQYLRELQSAGFSLFYGLGLASQSVIFLGCNRGFVLESDGLSPGRYLRPLKKPEDVYFKPLWRRFGVAVVLSGRVKEIDRAKKLFCLITEGRRQQWCRFKHGDIKELPEAGMRVEVFAWEKWNTRILEVLELRAVEAG